MKEIKSDLNPLFTRYPVWVVFCVSLTPAFLFMSVMPD